ncbi:MAG: hypothetical protein A2928_01445 [Candidatus Taylorbacteria bacterium RIFCSPLOWO2_01_FULL_45_15b]|uniref:DOD-type homing endonuclease domain-containing protein n=1 Tax=Candidatus Taylorbacteria bacterium RIFCSPLOWO2_01_FULL_45_15b TaxID=1802319 RepID=A0A1G2NFI1_9BACT|nr:MAG: hypothetical protein A2928_01445 [Candidatus Taylorbacteria bacterium RIFCSPLOWO2_01_FULL_45_15b]
MLKHFSSSKSLHAYIIGLALGDGNLSNPNGRATRLRITCDKKYPQLITEVQASLTKLLPSNKVSVINRTNCVDISCYSNHFENLLRWKVSLGSKFRQKVRVPDWIKAKNIYIKECLRGLLQTDGSIYLDRGYTMVNFVSCIPTLAMDVISMMNQLGYKPNIQKFTSSNLDKYTIRISRRSTEFINEINLWKK